MFDYTFDKEKKISKLQTHDSDFHRTLLIEHSFFFSCFADFKFFFLQTQLFFACDMLGKNYVVETYDGLSSTGDRQCWPRYTNNEILTNITTIKNNKNITHSS